MGFYRQKKRSSFTFSTPVADAVPADARGIRCDMFIPIYKDQVELT